MALNWQEIVQKYIIGQSDKIQKITKPLREKLDVGYFTYHRIDHDGRYTVLVDRPDWAEFYVDRQFYLDDPYLRHPSVYQRGCCSFQSNGSNEYRERISRYGKEIFNLDYNVMLIEKDAASVEFFGFAANQGKNRLENVALNCPNLLKAFASHFKRELSFVLQRMQEEAGSLIHLKGSDFFTKDPIHPNPKIDGLLEDIGRGDVQFLAAKLSVQEKKCLKGILLAKSAKTIARDLKLSPRTVESYIENIKNKLSCSSRQELFALASAFKDFGILP